MEAGKNLLPTQRLLPWTTVVAILYFARILVIPRLGGATHLPARELRRTFEYDNPFSESDYHVTKQWREDFGAQTSIQHSSLVCSSIYTTDYQRIEQQNPCLQPVRLAFSSTDGKFLRCVI